MPDKAEIELKALSPARLKRTAKTNMVSSERRDATAIMERPPFMP